MGYTASMSQILSIPIFACATITAVAVAFATDRLRHRFGFIILGVLVASTGYAIMLNMTKVHVGVRYFACFLITTGGYIAQPVTIAWTLNQMGGHYKRSMAAAIQIGIGNCGGIVASNIFLAKEKPYYKTGFRDCDRVSDRSLWGLGCCYVLWDQGREQEEGSWGKGLQVHGGGRRLG